MSLPEEYSVNMFEDVEQKTTQNGLGTVLNCFVG